MIGVPINKPLPRWRFYLVRPWLKFWTGLFLRAGLGLWPRFVGWKHYDQAKKERQVPDLPCPLAWAAHDHPDTPGFNRTGTCCCCSLCMEHGKHMLQFSEAGMHHA